jgi:hemerythrin-like domain-containing protein
MRTVDDLRTEHEVVLEVLDQLERAVASAEQGALVPADVFTDIQELFATFVDLCHHSKEEAEVFPRLKTGAYATLAQRLEEEHGTGRKLAGAYADAVEDYVPGDAETSTKLADAARAYSAFLREHIELETEELFPAMDSELSSQDGAMFEGFEHIEEERIGPGMHERLHAMVEGLEARLEGVEGDGRES